MPKKLGIGPGLYGKSVLYLVGSPSHQNSFGWFLWAGIFCKDTFNFTWNDTKKMFCFDSLNKLSARQNLIKPTVFRSFFLCAVQYMSFRQSLFRAKLKVKLYSPRVPIFLCAQRSFINSFECRFESLGSHWVELFSEREFIQGVPA